MTKATEPSPLNIHQRLLEVMNIVTYIQKEKKQGMNYSIVSHDKVTAKVRPALIGAGITYYPVHIATSQSGNRSECVMITRFTNADDPSDFIDVHSYGQGIDTQDKGPGKAQSYAVKYALLKVLGLETGDDPDLDQQVEYSSPAAEKMKEFEREISKATSDVELNLLRDEYAEHIQAAATTHAAQVNSAKQKWAAKSKALKSAADQDKADQKHASQ